ncbi:MAG: hypothetical protein KBT03_07120 [Bacteroidales bacterium]|nr:hypothetical protein [Candidatus Scybalousia scybalohippi]
MIYTIIVRDDKSEIEKIISFDSITSFDESYSAQICKNPVERGFVISDHIVLENRKFDISGIVSAYSVFDEGLELTWSNGAFVSPSDNSSSYTERHIRIEDDIRNLLVDRKVFSVLRSYNNSYNTDDTQKLKDLESTQVELIENCVISSLSFSQGSGISGAVFPKMSVEQVQVAVTQTETLTTEEQKPLLQKIPKPTGQANIASATTDGDGKSTNETVADKTTIGKTKDSNSKALIQDAKNASTIDIYKRARAVQEMKNFEMARISETLD